MDIVFALVVLAAGLAVSGLLLWCGYRHFKRPFRRTNGHYKLNEEEWHIIEKDIKK